MVEEVFAIKLIFFGLRDVITINLVRSRGQVVSRSALPAGPFATRHHSARKHKMSPS